jgi:hypothetical protein
MAHSGGRRITGCHARTRPLLPVRRRKQAGFVGAAEAKDALAKYGRVPFLIVRGRKGGSAMAAAAVNALASETE